MQESAKCRNHFSEEISSVSQHSNLSTYELAESLPTPVSTEGYSEERRGGVLRNIVGSSRGNKAKKDNKKINADSVDSVAVGPESGPEASPDTEKKDEGYFEDDYEDEVVVMKPSLKRRGTNSSNKKSAINKLSEKSDETSTPLASEAVVDNEEYAEGEGEGSMSPLGVTAAQPLHDTLGLGLDLAPSLLDGVDGTEWTKYVNMGAGEGEGEETKDMGMDMDMPPPPGLGYYSRQTSDPNFQLTNWWALDEGLDQLNGINNNNNNNNNNDYGYGNPYGFADSGSQRLPDLNGPPGLPPRPMQSNQGPPPSLGNPNPDDAAAATMIDSDLFTSNPFYFNTDD